MSGGSLRHLLEKYGTFQESVIKNFLIQIVFGLKYLHSKGIIHKNLNSENILLNEKGEIKICDFTSAQIIHNKDLHKDKIKEDIWNLGRLSLELNTGKIFWSTYEEFTSRFSEIENFSDQFLIKEISRNFGNFIQLCLNLDNDYIQVETLLTHPFLI